MPHWQTQAFPEMISLGSSLYSFTTHVVYTTFKYTPSPFFFTLLYTTLIFRKIITSLRHDGNNP